MKTLLMLTFLLAPAYAFVASPLSARSSQITRGTPCSVLRDPLRPVQSVFSDSRVRDGRGKAIEMPASKIDLSASVSTWSLATLALIGSMALLPPNVAAISGGGLDYAGLNLTGQDFSKGKYKSKDFSGAVAKEVNFKGSDLRGSRFFKADLKQADFSGANLGTASLEEADLEGTILTDAVATGSYFGNNMGNVGDISGADFTDALIRKDIIKALCQRPDAKGVNPTTGIETRDSLLCDMY